MLLEVLLSDCAVCTHMTELLRVLLHVLPVLPGARWQQVTPNQRYSIDSSSRANSPTKQAAAAALAAGSADFISPQHSSKQAATRAANVLLNAAVVCAFTAYTCGSKQRLLAVAMHLSAMAAMWRAMELLMWAASAPAENFLGMTLAPHFRNPFASASLTDFWARRWNITQGLVLRFFVYEPIIQGRLVAAEPLAAPTTTAAAAGGPLATEESAAAVMHSKQHIEESRAAPMAQSQPGAPLAPASYEAVQNGPAGAAANICNGGSDPPCVAGSAQHDAVQASSMSSIDQPSSTMSAGLRHRKTAGVSRLAAAGVPCTTAARTAATKPATGRLGGVTSSSSDSTVSNGLYKRGLTSAHSADSGSVSESATACSCGGHDCCRLAGGQQQQADGLKAEQQPGRQQAAAAATSPSVPLLAGPSAAFAPRWRRQLAAAATFVVSGLEHELVSGRQH